MAKVKPIPDGVPVVMPMLVCRDAAAEIDFCKTAFGAVEVVRRPGPDGTVAHALVTIGPAMVSHGANHRSLGARVDRLHSRRRDFGRGEAESMVRRRKEGCVR